MLCSFCVSEHAEDEYTIACLLFVFVAVSIPKLARSELSVFRAPLEGMYNGGGGAGERTWQVLLSQLSFHAKIVIK